MDVRDLHPWPSTPEEAEAIQDLLRPMLELDVPGPAAPSTVAGLDVSYAGDGGGTGDRLAAAVVVLDGTTLEVVEESVAVGTAAFPYVPGLFAFRELPTLLEALRGLTTTPGLLVCDGFGIAHPRRFGLACHLGVLTGLPAIGVGKTAFIGTYDQPGARRGDAAPLRDGGEVVGRVLRTRDGVKPVFVSVGHRTDLGTACRNVLALAREYRLPETTRRADRLSRDALAAASG
ncbi:endonuclease V [Actinomadura darangshiensis]|uniref:Endonuclease V n=1 Tax=Actinomadura darangshiensis TaxID=705336 RepID=A0A4R5AIT8_9ACTN|nr:endonuclease V [Actinomadura darangshiensis]TDD70894.1 endonuclease V [Actinomadura darangshiensis]